MYIKLNNKSLLFIVYTHLWSYILSMLKILFVNYDNELLWTMSKKMFTNFFVQLVHKISKWTICV